MAGTALERVLHEQCTEWGRSITDARAAVGFSFELSDDERWQWLTSGGHAKTEGIAEKEVRRLGVEDFYTYYLSCFYSKYKLPSSIIDFDAIKGPPWVSFKCPAANYGPKWHRSVQQARAKVYGRSSPVPAVTPNDDSGAFLCWFKSKGADEIADMALQRVNKLGMGDVNSVLWLCCLLPPGIKWMFSRLLIFSKSFIERFPFAMEWESFGAMCPERHLQERERAHPSFIDWTHGIPQTEGFPILPPKPGIEYRMESDQNRRKKLGIIWDPLIATSEKEVADAARALHRFYVHGYLQRDLQEMPGTFRTLYEEKRKGGRPSWGPAPDAIARQCALLRREDLSYKEIAIQMGFALEKDSYRNPSYSRTAKKYVERGNKLLQADSSI